MADEEKIYRTCSRCGTQELSSPDGLPDGWSIGTDGKRMEYLCGQCLRMNIRNVESSLPQEWWE